MGDAERATLVRALARVRRDRRAAVLWVEHDWRLVRHLADRVVVIEAGRVLVDGKPSDVLADANIRRILASGQDGTWNDASRMHP